MWNPKFVPRIQKFQTTTKRHFELYDMPTAANGGDMRRIVLAVNQHRYLWDLPAGVLDSGNVDGWDHYSSTTTHDRALCIGAKITLNFDQRYCQGYTLYCYYDNAPTTTFTPQQLENQLGFVFKQTLEEGIGHNGKRTVQIPYKPYYVNPTATKGSILENDNLSLTANSVTSASSEVHYLHICLVPTHEQLNRRLAQQAGDDTELCGIWGQIYLSQVWIAWIENDPFNNRMDDEVQVIRGIDADASDQGYAPAAV